MKRGLIAVFMTCSSRREARSISDALLAERLIACANIVPAVESKFRWKGKVETSPEVLVVMKTARTKFARLESRIRRLHSYEVPEIIALPAVEASRPYGRWIEESVA
jgi:periplasmic divalent cation tolerance protein